MQVSQATVSRMLTVFVNAIASDAPRYIYIPRSEEYLRAVNEFKLVAGLHRVVGAIDGSLVPIIALSADEYVYVNRKRFHSINILAICDENLIFQKWWLRGQAQARLFSPWNPRLCMIGLKMVNWKIVGSWIIVDTR